MGMPYCAAAARAAAAVAEVEAIDAVVSSPKSQLFPPSFHVRAVRTCTAKLALLLLLLLGSVEGRVGLVDQGSVGVGANVGERRLVSGGGR